MTVLAPDVTVARVARLERAAARAVRPETLEMDDGWALRADPGGVVRRANSVWAEGAGEDPLAHKLARTVAWYRARGRSPAIQVSPASAPSGLAEALQRAGWRFVTPVLVCERALAEADAATSPAHVWLLDAPDARWLAAYASVLSELEVAPRARLAGRSPAPRAFAVAPGRGCGLAVLDGDLVGIFDVATVPTARRGGVARAVTAALLAWAVRAGARTAYLQVAEANVAALALYAGLGFRPAYRYAYAWASEDQPRS